jgi:hypothetical protein
MKMNLSEIYLREVYLKKFCEDLEESLQLAENIGNADLSSLLQKAEETIFPRFGIKSNQPNKYFIGGSAHLHLYPEVSALLKDKPGDLDIVIPGDDEWKYLVKYLDHNKIKYDKEEVAQGIFRPEGKEGPIEAFKEWDPAKLDPEKYKDTRFTPTPVILRTSNRKSIGGYYFMPLYDIVDYKMKLNRTKEEGITNLLTKYISATDEKEKQTIRNQIIQLFAEDEVAAKSFLAPSLANKVKE